MTEIEVRGLTKTFGAITAVRDVSFTAPDGKITGFLGPNGSGKTTTLRVALGLIRPSAGEVLIGGVPYRRLAQPRRRVGALLETTGFHPGRRARGDRPGRHHVHPAAPAVGRRPGAARVRGHLRRGRHARYTQARCHLGNRPSCAAATARTCVSTSLPPPRG
ncbi:MAG TPA: ATP-binding cassette domain-containing protein [Streptosporangiaceae bacterium]|nr:ATP-binding cassette domain-containing protein [Streptosporangiaceae bacterium]